ncbi:MAG: NADH-quinone oxidoreductase subunit E, partial [Pararhodobacter sp.]|nr:NADH-quinone oxidoreductase subunit E [Pararhodobacter sp.]
VDPEPATSAAADVGTKPATLAAPRAGRADDLKRIKGIGPKLEALCNRLGFWHFDQIANWTDEEIAWVDANLEAFKGRVTRDNWVAQARDLAAGQD